MYIISSPFDVTSYYMRTCGSLNSAPDQKLLAFAFTQHSQLVLITSSNSYLRFSLGCSVPFPICFHVLTTWYVHKPAWSDFSIRFSYRFTFIRLFSEHFEFQVSCIISAWSRRPDCLSSHGECHETVSCRSATRRDGNRICPTHHLIGSFHYGDCWTPSLPGTFVFRFCRSLSFGSISHRSFSLWTVLPKSGGSMKRTCVTQCHSRTVLGDSW